MGVMVYELVGHGITTMLPKAYLVSSPIFIFRMKMLVMCCIEHRMVESESSIMEISGVIPVKTNNGSLPSRAAQAMWLRR